MKLFFSMLNRTIWIRSLGTCRAITCTLKQTRFDVLLNDDVYAMEIAPSEVAWWPVKVKGIQ